MKWHLKKIYSIFFISFFYLCGASSNLSFSQKRKRADIGITEKKKTKKSIKKKSPNPARSSAFYATVEKKLIDNIDKTINFLKRTEKTLSPGSAEKLQIMERILNLHLEQAIYVRSEEERSYDRNWKKWEAKGKKSREPKLNTNRSTNHWKSLISKASAILKEYPRNKSADIISYNKAIGYQYLGYEKESAKMYSNIIKKYPNSDVLGSAYVSLGDYFFDKNDFQNAYNNYFSSLRFNRSKQYLWSLFKIAWCSYNLGQYKKAVRFWKKVVSESRNRTSNEGGGLQLKEEALRDMAYGFAELMQIDSAISYYKKNEGTQYIGSFLLLLSQILSDQGKYGSAIQVLKKFQKIAPYDEKGPNSQKEIISLNYALGRLNTVWSEISFLLKTYNPKSNWAKKQTKEVVLATWVDIKEQTLYYGSIVHQKSIENDNIQLNKQAKIGYKLYLKYFSNSKEAPTVKYYLADIAYYLGDYREAGQYYYSIASLGKKKALKYNFKTEKFTNMHRDVSIEMVAAFVKDFEPEFKVLKKKTPNFKKTKKISSRANNYINACNYYIAWYPEDKKRVKTCEVGISTIYYRNGIREKAKENFLKLATKYPNSKEGKNSAKLLVSMTAKNEVEFNKVSSILLKTPQFRSGPIGKEIALINRDREKSSISKLKDPFLRGKKYEAQARRFPKDLEVDKLWYNAAINYIEAGKVDNALFAYSVLWKRFPKKAQSKFALLQLAKIYESKLELRLALGYLYAYYKKFPQDKLASTSLLKSCELSVALESKNALNICMELSRKDAKSASYFVEKLIRSFFLRKDKRNTKNIINNYYFKSFKISANEKILALYKLVKLYGKNSSEGTSANKKIIGTYRANRNQVNGEALRIVSKQFFDNAMKNVPNYKKMKLRGGSVQNLITSLSLKVNALNSLEKYFSIVIGTKDPYWGAASFYILGESNENLARQLENPPTIKGAKKKDVIAQLKPQIKKLNESSNKWYNNGISTVSKYKVYSNYSRKLAEKIAKRNRKISITEDYVPIIDNISNLLSVGSIESIR